MAWVGDGTRMVIDANIVSCRRSRKLQLLSLVILIHPIIIST